MSQWNLSPCMLTIKLIEKRHLSPFEKNSEVPLDVAVWTYDPSTMEAEAEDSQTCNES